MADNVLTNDEIVIGLPDYQISGMERRSGEVPATATVNANGVRDGMSGGCGLKPWGCGTPGWRYWPARGSMTVKS